MNILKRFLKCCSGNIAQPQGLCDHLTSHTQHHQFWKIDQSLQSATLVSLQANFIQIIMMHQHYES
jgi:hypothetical protein